MSDTAIRQLYTALPSDELRAIFSQLKESEGRSGSRYTQQCVRDLTKKVVGFSYEPTLLKLCHMIRASALSERLGRFEVLFGVVDTARPSAFRYEFERRRGTLKEHIALLPTCVELQYTDSSFQVHYKGMPELAAMLDFLWGAVGYGVLDAHFEPLKGASISGKTVSQVANSLARDVYAYLKDHLLSSHRQDQFRAIIEYLEMHLGDEFTYRELDDELLLQFWEKQNCDQRRGTADFIKYSTAFRAFLNLISVLRDGGARAEFDRPTSMDDDAGVREIDSEAVDDTAAEEWNPLNELHEEPACLVKVLTKKDYRALELPITEYLGLRQLRLSYLRSECFGGIQNQLGNSETLINTITGGIDQTNDDPEHTYINQITLLEKLSERLRNAALASYYVISKHRSNDDSDVEHVEFAELSKAKKAFSSINRQGYGKEALESELVAGAHRSIAELLPVVSERIGDLTRSLGGLNRDWSAIWLEDKGRFYKVFTCLYGDKS